MAGREYRRGGGRERKRQGGEPLRGTGRMGRRGEEKRSRKEDTGGGRDGSWQIEGSEGRQTGRGKAQRDEGYVWIKG